MRALLVAIAAAGGALACSPVPAPAPSAAPAPRPAAANAPTPAPTLLPTRQTTIDRAKQGLDAAQAESERQRAEIDRATR